MPNMQSWAVVLENWIAHKEVFRPTVPVPVTTVFATKDVCRRRRDGSKFDFSEIVRAATRASASLQRQLSITGLTPIVLPVLMTVGLQVTGDRSMTLPVEYERLRYGTRSSYQRANSFPEKIVRHGSRLARSLFAPCERFSSKLPSDAFANDSPRHIQGIWTTS